MKQFLALFILVVVSTTLSGCAHYALPVSHLDSPESRGAGAVGRLELAGVFSGVNLNTTAKRVEPVKNWMDPTAPLGTATQDLTSSPVNYAIGFVTPISERIDVGVRLEPYAPLQARAKYQFLGSSETNTAPQQLAGSLNLTLGGTMGKGQGNATFTYLMADAALPVGYRFLTNHLFSWAPFVTYASLNSLPVALGLPTSTTTYSGSVMQYGWALGYQYTLEGLMFRLELAYDSGSMLDARIHGLHAGALIGLKI